MMINAEVGVEWRGSVSSMCLEIGFGFTMWWRCCAFTCFFCVVCSETRVAGDFFFF